MKIVIDIQEAIYDQICKEKLDGIMARAIRCGRPLPKGHGRLIDGDELASGCDEPFWCRWLSEIEDAPTIVPAEMEVEDTQTAKINTPTDYISRQAAMDALWSLDAELRPSTIDAMINMLNGLPSIDAVPVVRCKDCKHRYHSVECPCQSYDHFYSWMPADDWFCKKGERKKE